MRPYGPLDPLEHLDASLESEFDPTTVLLRRPTLEHLPQNQGQSSSGAAVLRSSELTSEDLPSDNESLSEEASAGGYSPPAWRRLGNGGRNNGFWRNHHPLSQQDDYISENEDFDGLRESSPEMGNYEDDGDEILRRAIQTRLPRGSMSPDKERSPEPTTTTVKGGYFPAARQIQTLDGIEEVMGMNGGLRNRKVENSMVAKKEAATDYDEENEKATLRAVPERNRQGVEESGSLWKDSSRGGEATSENCKFRLFFFAI